MLKKVHFEGCVFIDVKRASSFEYESQIRDNINEIYFDVTSIKIKNVSDIPIEWSDCIPFGREDDKTCAEIFYDEIAPKLELDDKKQIKFEFYDEVKTKKEEVTNG